MDFPSGENRGPPYYAHAPGVAMTFPPRSSTLSSDQNDRQISRAESARDLRRPVSDLTGSVHGRQTALFASLPGKEKKPCL